MRILVVGASQGTGALCVQNALDRGHEVTAFARSPDKLALTDARLRKISGNFHDAASVAGAMPGHDAVIITASSTSMKGFKENPNYFSQGTAHVIEAMRRSGSPKRLVVLSALGVGESRKLMPWILDKLLIGFLLRAPYVDHERQEAMAMQSGLEWVVVRPGGLTNGPAKKTYVKKTAIERLPTSISRADVADFLVECCMADEWVGKAVQIGG